MSPVDLKIQLPDREVVTVTVRKSSDTEEVYAAVIDKIRMNKNTAKYFYLFEIVEYNFGKSHGVVDWITLAEALVNIVMNCN